MTAEFNIPFFPWAWTSYSVQASMIRFLDLLTKATARWCSRREILTWIWVF